MTVNYQVVVVIVPIYVNKYKLDAPIAIRSYPMVDNTATGTLVNGVANVFVNV